MNQAQLQGNWQQFKGNVKKHWGKLTDDDLLKSEGKSDILIGKLTERYGISKEKAEKKWNNYLERFDDAGNEIKSLTNNISHIAENISERAVDSVEGYKKVLQEKPFAAATATAGAAALVGAVIGALVAKPHK